ncbi:uncharacterized protein BDV14DRAFT_205268 [Aspergillus stella-maris]|uniref:uncharacterized protein n=1 Tax=Aspergillus stella-maris TaxID=1810926 RepID=UPI003CCD461C
MSSPRVLRIRRSDDVDSHILLHVSRSDPTALELHLTATEGESPYTTTLKQSQLPKLKAHNFQGSDDDWKEAVLRVLGLQEGTSNNPALLGIGASASIIGDGESDREVLITVLKRIQTITQKLGSFTLPQNDERSIELFEWSSIAISRADTYEERFDSLVDRVRTADDTIDLLNKQLEEFVDSKNQHEQQLMSDFVQLLNEKKLKIRNQQRLLASAKSDPEKLSTLHLATSTDDVTRDTKGRNPKRAADTLGDETDSEEGFGETSIDKSEQPVNDSADEEADDGGRSTPQAVEDDYSTTSDDEGSAPSIGGSQREKERKREVQTRTKAESPPPRRDLPFARKTEKKPAPARTPPTRQDHDETGGETDDDEL